MNTDLEQNGHSQQTEQNQHSILSPSGAHKWTICPSSVVEYHRSKDNQILSLQTPSYTDEGTQAHELAQKHLSEGVELPDNEMGRAVDFYAKYVIQNSVLSNLKVEQKIQISVNPYYAPFTFGTCDAYFVDEVKKQVHVFDLKYGVGVSVSAYKNPQLGLYGLGIINSTVERLGLPASAADEFTLTAHIIQPRMEKADSYVWILDDFQDLKKRCIEAMSSIFSGKAPVRAGEHCQFCNLEARCKESLKTSFADLAPFLNSNFEALTLEEVVTLHEGSDKLKKWITMPKEAIYSALYRGEKIEGYSLKPSFGNRAWDATSTSEVLEMAIAEGLDPYKNPEMKSPTMIEKELGKKKFTAFNKYVIRPDLGLTVKKTGSLDYDPNFENMIKNVFEK